MIVKLYAHGQYKKRLTFNKIESILSQGHTFYEFIETVIS